MNEYKPKVVCFSCKFSWGYLVDEAVLSRRIENWIPIICTGKIDTTHIMDAFEKGADGILILGCPEGDCHYQDGNYEAKKRVYLLRKILESMGLEKERVKIELSSDPDGRRIPELVKEMKEELAKLGPRNRNAVAGKMPQKEAIKAGGRK
jgi:F420-non-reducing hydrogenase iron-sulfur subunit